MQKKIVIFGAGGTGRAFYEKIKGDNEVKVVSFVDNFKTGELFGIPIVHPKDLKSMDFDYIYLETVAVSEVLEDLSRLGVDENKIVRSVVTYKSNAREEFLERFAEEIYRKGIKGNVAEAGVFRGGFAKLINKAFYDRKLHLFDTFEGFDERDIAFEENWDENPSRGEYFKETSIDLVMSKMIYPENIVLHKGYVPKTLNEVDDNFCFVNLDMDLYKPTLEALRYFYPRLVHGGGILVHDYFDVYSFQNLKQGVIEFVEEAEAISFPIGDGLSVLIVK